MPPPAGNLEPNEPRNTQANPQSPPDSGKLTTKPIAQPHPPAREKQWKFEWKFSFAAAIRRTRLPGSWSTTCQTIEKRSHTRKRQPVVNLQPALFILKYTRRFQNRKMPGNRGPAALGNVHQFTNATLPSSQRLHNSQPRRMPQCLEDRGTLLALPDRDLGVHVPTISQLCEISSRHHVRLLLHSAAAFAETSACFASPCPRAWSERSREAF